MVDIIYIRLLLVIPIALFGTDVSNYVHTYVLTIKTACGIANYCSCDMSEVIQLLYIP